LPHFFIIYSSLSVIRVLSPLSLLVIWSNILLSLLIHSIGNQLLCYVLFMITLLLVHNPVFFSIKLLLKLNERQSFLFEVCVAWLNAKCLSLSIDRIRNGSHKSFKLNDMIKSIAYCLYLPALYTGPIYQYSTFINDVRNQVLLTYYYTKPSLLRSSINFRAIGD